MLAENLFMLSILLLPTFISSQSDECNPMMYTRCANTLAHNFNFHSGRLLNLPVSALEFAAAITEAMQPILDVEGSTLKVCGNIVDFFECVGFKPSCFNSSVMHDLGITDYESKVYLQLFAAYEAQCNKLLKNQDQFTCSGRGDMGHVSHIEPCGRKFYLCNGDASIPMNCDKGESLDTELQTCRNIGDIDRCSDYRMLADYFSVESPCSNLDDANCGRYSVECFQSMVEVFSCPSGELFDSESISCKLKSEIPDCNEGVITPLPTTSREMVPTDAFVLITTPTLPPTTTPPLAPSTTLSPISLSSTTTAASTMAVVTTTPVPPLQTFDCSNKPDGNYQNPHDLCSKKYFTCLVEVAVERTCPFDLRFRDDNKICTSPKYMEECASVVKVNCSGGQTNLPHPYLNCSKVYYSCKNGDSHLRTCPTNLRYDKQFDMCDFESALPVCGGTRNYTLVHVGDSFKNVGTAAPSTEVPTTKPPFEPDSGSLNKMLIVEPIENYTTTTPIFSAEMMMYTDEDNSTMANSDDVSNTTDYMSTTRRTDDTITKIHQTTPKMMISEITNQPMKKMPTNPLFDCYPGVNEDFADPSEKCSPIYFSCQGGVVFNKTCEDDLFYDPDLNVCNLKRLIRACEGLTATGNVIEEHKISCKGIPRGYFANPNRPCSTHYYACFGGDNPTLMSCDKPFYWDPFHQRCDDFRSVVACRKPEPIECQNVGENFANPKRSCSSIYYACDNGVGVERYCPDDTIFDEVLNACEEKEFVPACDGERRMVAMDTTKKIRCSDTSDLRNLADPENICSQYYYFCEDDLQTFAMREKCPKMTYFDETDGRCKEKDRVSCCAAFDCLNRSTGFYQDPQKECSKYFYSCVHGVSRLHKCNTPDTYFDVGVGLCDASRFVPDCGGEREQSIEDVDPPGSDIISDIECVGKKRGNFQDPDQNCSNQFFACAGGEFAIRFRCTFGLYYSEARDRCDYYRHVADCTGIAVEDDGSTEKSDEPTAIPRPQFEPMKCLGPGNFANPDQNCSRYFLSCAARNAMPITQICQPRTFFDEEKNMCEGFSKVPACIELAKKVPIIDHDIKCPSVSDIMGEVNIAISNKPCSREFYQCSDEVPFLDKCPHDYVFSAHYEKCVPRSHVEGC